MHPNDAPPAQATDFLDRFNGGFTGILHWHQLDRLWESVASGEGWYIYPVGEMPPDAPADSERLRDFLRGIDRLLRAEHDEDYCGVVYVDSPQAPSLIKIFDPNNLGSSCGSSGLRVLPGWVLSLARPVDLPAAMPPTRSRRRWWQSLLDRA